MHRRDVLRILTVSPFLVAAARQPSPRAGFVPDVELGLTAAPDAVAVLPGAATRVWRFTGRVIKGPADAIQPVAGSYLGPTISVRTGQKVRIRFTNQLPEHSIVHWHGLDVPENADGHPRLAIPTGQEYVYDFEVTNRAGTYWYHPHPHMRTGAQVYQGLAGLFLVRDAEEEALGLPSGEAEHLCVLQDRRFDAGNQLVFRGNGMMEMMNGYLGDRVLVSGVPQPTKDVDAAWHRVRLLNGSNARFYKLAWSRDLPMTVIGGEAGLHEHAVTQRSLTLAPGQRADVLLDLTSFAAGTEVHLESLSFPEADAGMVGMMGMMGGRMGGMATPSSVPNGAALRVMTLRTRAKKGPAFRVPDRLSTFDGTWATKSRCAGPSRAAALSAHGVVARRPHVRHDRRGARGNRRRRLHAYLGIHERGERHGHAGGPSHSHARPPVPRARSLGRDHQRPPRGHRRRRLEGHGARAARRDRPRAGHVHQAPGAVSLPLPHPRARGHGDDAELPRDVGYERCLRYEFLSAIFPFFSVKTSQPLTSTFAPSFVVPVNVHSDTARSPATKWRGWFHRPSA